jgi:hypothetical protein
MYKSFKFKGKSMEAEPEAEVPIQLEMSQEMTQALQMFVLRQVISYIQYHPIHIAYVGSVC